MRGPACLSCLGESKNICKCLCYSIELRGVSLTNIFRPGFTIQFNRTPNLSASWAQFTVPLWFNKLDLRDYLWNVYNVRTHGIRTYVLPSAIRPRKNPLPGKKKLIRPQNKKRMTVELDNPFVWPDPPTVAELNEGWKKDMIRTVSKGKYKAAIGREEGLREQREELRERAQRLIKGAERWSTIKPFQGPQGLTRMFSRR